MSSSVFHRVQTIAADVFKVPVGEITPRSSPETIATWDSVQHLNLVLALEEAFGVQFEPEEMDGMVGIDRILSVVEAKVQQRV